jgi:hypothetical protein
MANNQSEKYLSFLTTALQTQGNYHNHKENMAWVATALYVPSIIALGYFIESKIHDENIALSCWQFLLIFLILAIFAVLVFIFVYRQFKLRSKAADYFDAFIELLNDLSHDDSVIDSWNKDFEIIKDKHWPKFVENKVVEGKGRNTLTMRTTDLPCYIAICFSSIIAMLLVCI